MGARTYTLAAGSSCPCLYGMMFINAYVFRAILAVTYDKAGFALDR